MGKKHGLCPWCSRMMVKSTPNRLGQLSRMHPTWDHYPIPKSLNGWQVVKCCLQCNHIKGNMLAEEWAEFRVRYPGYWRNFDQDCAPWFIRELSRGTLPMASDSPPVDLPARQADAIRGMIVESQRSE